MRTFYLADEYYVPEELGSKHWEHFYTWANFGVYVMSYNENVTFDWCWQCNNYHHTEAGQPLNTKCKESRIEKYERKKREEREEQDVSESNNTPTIMSNDSTKKETL